MGARGLESRAAQVSPLEAARLGQELHAAGKYAQALAAYDRALRGGFQSLGLYFNFGSLLARVGRSRRALKVLGQGLACYPTDRRLLSEYLVCVLESPDLPASAKAEEHLLRVRQAGFPSPARPSFPAHRGFRIGCVSAEFREHPKAFLQFRHFRFFDRRRFQLYFYSTGKVEDAYTAEARATADCWRDAAGRTPDEIADLIRQDEIDILLDVSGHFANSSLSVLALRPAPLQVSLSGYPATTGLSQVDFKVVDAVTDPETAAPWYAEKLYRLDRPFACYAASPDAPPVSQSPVERNGFVTFGCFNRRSKITQPMLSLWAKILRETPGSVLLFHHPIGWEPELPVSVRRQFADFFRSRGVSSGRLKFQGYRPLHDHLACISDVDIALDTSPYAGMTITFDCLWMGVPVVTMAGDAHVSRTGASLLSCVNLKDWIADSPRRYVEIATSRARDRQGLVKLRAQLREDLRASPLTHGADYVGALQRAFAEMWTAIGGPDRPPIS